MIPIEIHVVFSVVSISLALRDLKTRRIPGAYFLLFIPIVVFLFINLAMNRPDALGVFFLREGLMLSLASLPFCWLSQKKLLGGADLRYLICSFAYLGMMFEPNAYWEIVLVIFLVFAISMIILSILGELSQVFETYLKCFPMLLGESVPWSRTTRGLFPLLPLLSILMILIPGIYL